MQQVTTHAISKMQTEKPLHRHLHHRPRSSSPMSELGSGDFRSKKRFRVSPAAKFQINERVQVRSVEKGFLGSWHSCTVIHREKGRRHVRYENVLDDSGLEHLVGVVIVSRALDGCFSFSDLYRRGMIRPLPPLIEFEKRDLEFGVCVDVYREKAWWEGVVFDHCDGMEERSVFFPDSGDEMRVGVDQLRITQDWDEITEKWERRGKWAFVEFIEECERESYVAVSPKQIWYDVRGRTDFGVVIGEWTFNVKGLLRNMVKEAVGYYHTLTVNEIYSVLDLPGGCSSNETQQTEKENSEPKESAILPVEKDLPVFPKEISCCGAGEVVSGVCSSWKPLKLSEIEFCPVSIEQCAHAKSKETMKFWKEKVTKHLAYLGWEIEWAEEKSGAKCYKYKSPEKLGHKVYLSLVELCNLTLDDSNIMNSMLPQNDQECLKLNSPPSPEVISPGVARRIESLERNYLNLQQTMEQRFQALQEILLARLPMPQASPPPPQ